MLYLALPEGNYLPNSSKQELGYTCLSAVWTGKKSMVDKMKLIGQSITQRSLAMVLNEINKSNLTRRKYRILGTVLWYAKC